MSTARRFPAAFAQRHCKKVYVKCVHGRIQFWECAIRSGYHSLAECACQGTLVITNRSACWDEAFQLHRNNCIRPHAFLNAIKTQQTLRSVLVVMVMTFVVLLPLIGSATSIPNIEWKRWTARSDCLWHVGVAGQLLQQLTQSFANHSSSDCRQQHFEILRSAWQLRPAMHAALRPALLSMLGDADPTIRAQALEFWDSALTKHVGRRLQALLQDSLTNVGLLVYTSTFPAM